MISTDVRTLRIHDEQAWVCKDLSKPGNGRINSLPIMLKSRGQFGGKWTLEKLDCLHRYLKSYMLVMKNQSFKTGYIDAFAGTGYTRFREKETTSDVLFQGDMAEPEAEQFRKGSARFALDVEPPFDSYIYIEKNLQRAQELEKLKAEYPAQREHIQIYTDDANERLSKLCGPGKNWASHRAVLFLDPYGMQVDWTTIERIASTQAIDLLLLFPLGMGVMRLLRNDAQITPQNADRLTRLFGTDEWRNRFYKAEPEQNLFGDDPGTIKVATFETITNFWLERLRTIFPHVAPKGRVLCNSCNSALYLLCFAAGNQKGGSVALRIINRIFTKGG